MVEAYCKQFFGYGRWDAPVWFVGLEEAGTGMPEELQTRLEAWGQRGCRELEEPTIHGRELPGGISQCATPIDCSAEYFSRNGRYSLGFTLGSVLRSNHEKSLRHRAGSQPSERRPDPFRS